MKKDIREKLIRQAKDILFPYIDVSIYKNKIEIDELGTVNIVFINAARKEIVLSNIYYNDETGEILQYGSNYGRLVF